MCPTRTDQPGYEWLDLGGFTKSTIWMSVRESHEGTPVSSANAERDRSLAVDAVEPPMNEPGNASSERAAAQAYRWEAVVGQSDEEVCGPGAMFPEGVTEAPQDKG